jgi:hypothetical protein
MNDLQQQGRYEGFLQRGGCLLYQEADDTRERQSQCILLLESALLQEMDAKAAKQARQKGREYNKKDRRFEAEKRKIVEQKITPAQYRTVPVLDRMMTTRRMTMTMTTPSTS